jgi:hypothetical protein
MEPVERIMNRLRVTAIQELFDAPAQPSLPEPIFDPTAGIGQTERIGHQPFRVGGEMGFAVATA